MKATDYYDKILSLKTVDGIINVLEEVKVSPEVDFFEALLLLEAAKQKIELLKLEPGSKSEWELFCDKHEIGKAMSERIPEEDREKLMKEVGDKKLIVVDLDKEQFDISELIPILKAIGYEKSVAGGEVKNTNNESSGPKIRHAEHAIDDRNEYDHAYNGDQNIELLRVLENINRKHRDKNLTFPQLMWLAGFDVDLSDPENHKPNEHWLALIEEYRNV